MQQGGLHQSGLHTLLRYYDLSKSSPRNIPMLLRGGTIHYDIYTIETVIREGVINP